MKHNDSEIMRHGSILWDFHLMKADTQPTDFIIALGSHDLRTAKHAATLYLNGVSEYIIVTGGFGKVTKNIWGVTEAEKFKEILLEYGVPEEKILVENNSTNTGDNFVYSRNICREEQYPFTTGTIVTKPYMTRRAFATASKQWPEVTWHVSPPPISFEEYPNQEVSFEKMLQLMVGDLQRIKVYAKKGFQIEQDIPVTVWNSYNYLVSEGYDEFVIRE